MSLFKTLCFAFFSSICWQLGLSKSDDKLYTKATQCVGSEKFFYQNISCYAKSYSRTYSASFMYVLAKKPIFKDLKVATTIFYKYGQIFRDIVHFPGIDICSLVHDMNHNQLALNLALRTLLNSLKNAAPGLIHECPYYGLFVRNASWNLNSVPSIVPSGEYKLLSNVSIGNEFAGTFSVTVVVNSTIKNTF